MSVASPAARLDVRANHGPASPAETELVRLREQVARLKAERAALWWAAGHDELTGLANRRLFNRLAPLVLRSGRPAVLVVLDLNRFKPINDMLGHEMGDRVLQVIGQRLAGGAADLMARLGGDEFAAVYTNNAEATPTDCWWRAPVTALSSAIAQPIRLDGYVVSVTASIGIAAAQDGVPVRELLRRADDAMYHAKATGGGRRAVASTGATSTGATRPDGDDAAEQPPAPTRNPNERAAADIAPAGTYRPDDPVWVYREGAWRPGIVEVASGRAVLVTYRNGRGSGTVVDTVPAECILTRAACDAARPTADSGA